MKKLFAIIAFLGLFTLGISNAAMAQDEAAPQTEQAADQSATEGGLHKALKTKYIEGGADFMSSIAIALIFGLAFSLERIIYLSLADTNPSKLLKKTI